MIEILQNQVGATAASADKRIQLGYDPAGRINRIDGAGATNPVISSIFQRDGLGRLISLDHYDMLAWQADLATSTTPAVGGSILANYHFAFDLASQMTSMLSGLDGLSQYHYNSTAQLVGIETTDSTLPDQTFAFDDNGNRTDPETIVGVNNRLLQNADFNYVYDAEDRLVERHSRTDDTRTLYTWDHRGRLVSVAHYDVDPVSGLDVLLGHVTYQYDVFDRPVSSFSAEGDSNANPRQTHRIYDGQHLLLRFVDGELANRYLHGPLVDQLLVDERVDASESLSRWVLSDHQGTVRDLAVRDAITDEIIISNHRVFDAFGNLLSETAGGETTIFGYAGREWEEVADLQFNRALWYDPTIGRWISQDPIGFAAGDANLYRYVGNGATNYRDPSGLSKDGDGTNIIDDVITPPDGIKPGEMWIEIYARQVEEGNRNVYRNRFDYGHCSIAIGEALPNGKYRREVRGFYPTAPFQSLDREPQKGKVSNDVGKRYHVKYVYPLSSTGKRSYSDVVKFMDDYDGTKQYDFDERSCVHYVIDVAEFAGHPKITAGDVRITDGKDVIITKTPSALGEDLRDKSQKPK